MLVRIGRVVVQYSVEGEKKSHPDGKATSGKVVVLMP